MLGIEHILEQEMRSSETIIDSSDKQVNEKSIECLEAFPKTL